MKYKYLLISLLMAAWVYVVPMNLNELQNPDLISSNEFYGNARGNQSKLISIEKINRNLYLEEGNSTLISINQFEEIPKSIITCLINEEDRSYFENPMGINVRGIGRAIFKGNGGGSGICQQMIKNVFFTSDDSKTNTIKNMRRKFTEILLSLVISRNTNKEDVLIAYLNNIHVAIDHKGHGKLLGLKSSALYHFNKTLDELTFGESAILVAYMRSPGIQTNKTVISGLISKPNRKPHRFEIDYVNGIIDLQTYKTEVIKLRRNRILKNLLDQSKISKDQFIKYTSEPIILIDDFRMSSEIEKLSSLKDFIIKAQQERDSLMATLNLNQRGGLKIYTTLDLELQSAIQSVYSEVNSSWKISEDVTYKRNGIDTTISDKLQCAVFSVDKWSGSVIGMLGGRVGLDTDYNNYCFMKRQTGSTFKIFDYYTLFEQQPEFNSGTLVPDIKYSDYTYPRGKSTGRNISLREAIAQSSNIVPYNLIYKDYISLDQLQSVAARFKILINNPDQMGTLLGQDEATLAQMVNAYNAISNEGSLVQNYYINKITDSGGNILYQKTVDVFKIAIELNPTICFNLKQCFNGVIQVGGKASNIRGNKYVDVQDYNYGGKTGTTNNASNIWYIGYTPDITMGIWQGYSGSNIEKAGNSGSDNATIWSNIINNYYARK